jgi:diguanylate cyclase (GGDEF)-like protein
MISLRQAIEQQREELLRSALECCRSVVAAMAESGARVCPAVGDDFQHNLVTLCERLAAATAPAELSATEQQIGREIEGWSTRASQYFREKAGEIRDVMAAMNEAAKAAGDRDERYRVQFTEVASRLREIEDLEDLARIRQVMRRSAGELNDCADRMVRDGRQITERLKAQLAAYEQRLEQAERASSTDALTGLANRAHIEREIAARIAHGFPFCLVLLDLNGFKAVNDTYGHTAGDALLKGFAAEFRSQFRPEDPIGRWGGDEFVVLLDCPLPEARTRIGRVRSYALGAYSLPDGKRVTIGAAIGVAEWVAGCTAERLFDAADRAMYADKKQNA